MAYLDTVPVGELAELLAELPGSRQQPLGLGVLMVALNERLPDAYKLLPPAGQPGPVLGDPPPRGQKPPEGSRQPGGETRTPARLQTCCLLAAGLRQ